MTYDGTDADDDGVVEADVDNQSTTTETLSSEEASISEQPTGPDGSTVSTNAGIETTVAPSLSLIERQAEPFKRVVYQDGSDVYAVSQDTTGTVFKSSNYGNSWTNQGDVGETVKEIQRIETTGTLMVFAESGEVYRSTDDGASFSNVHSLAYPPLSAQGVTDTPSGNIVVGEYGNDGNTVYEIYISTDDGITWSSVLQSSGAAPAANPGHVHSVQYDPYNGKMVAYLDYGTPEIYVSNDDGATWSLLDTSDTSRKANYVSLMFFENNIAWGYDSFAENGWVRYMTRQDFYAGDWQDSQIKDVGKANDKMAYYSAPIASDTWILGFATESNEHPGNYSQEHYLIYDDGTKMTGALEHASPTADLDTLLGHKTTFPGYSSSTKDMGSDSWMNLNTAGQPRTYSSVPYSVGREASLPQTTNAFISSPKIPHNTQLRAGTSTGGETGILRLSGSDRTILTNGSASPLPELRIYQSGAFRFLHDGATTFTIDSGGMTASESISMGGNQLTGLREYPSPGINNLSPGELVFDSANYDAYYRFDDGTLVKFTGTVQ